ncbi:MAG: hypothetical protein Q7S22_02675, partial [Candidatus Micrarchaeota archaeon]|nr:hypothetical protein [Candidatus Micrarchaeota archaeon]
MDKPNDKSIRRKANEVTVRPDTDVFALLEIASDKTNSDKKRELAGMRAIAECIESRDNDTILMIAIGNGGEGTIIGESGNVESGTPLFR